MLWVWGEQSPLCHGRVLAVPVSIPLIHSVLHAWRVSGFPDSVVTSGSQLVLDSGRHWWETWGQEDGRVLSAVCILWEWLRSTVALVSSEQAHHDVSTPTLCACLLGPAAPSLPQYVNVIVWTWFSLTLRLLMLLSNLWESFYHFFPGQPDFQRSALACICSRRLPHASGAHLIWS